MTTRLALIGAHGFGRYHLEKMAGLRAAGRIDLVGVADPQGPSDLVDVACFASLGELLRRCDPEVVIVSTPIGTHGDLAAEALRAGCDVYLEKPPTPSLAEHHALIDCLAQTGRVAQVGFQALGGAGLTRVRELIAGGSLGTLTGVRGIGPWTRAMGYYRRSAWAGKRMLNGRRVADGVATNPLAHCVSVALSLAGCTDLAGLSVTTEAYQAHGIETDDTVFIAVRQPGSVEVSLGLTTSNPDQEDPWVDVVGTRGRARLYYTRDVVDVSVAGEPASTEAYGRASLLQNLLDHRDRGVPLIAPLAEQLPFTAVLEAIQSGPPPTAVDPAYVDWIGAGARAGVPAAEQPDEAVPVVRGVRDALLAATESAAGLRGVGVAWATAEPVTWRA